jgi:hypothetical protein
MPRRDHFHPPLRDRVHWEGFHSAWTNTIVRHLNTRLLPSRYRSEPQVDLGALEVRVHDDQRGSRLVAAVELVSPANKERPEHRKAFVAKCAAYLRQGVAVTMVDVITERHANLHAELLEALGRPDHNPWADDAHLYAVAYRTTREKDSWQMETWAERLAVGAALPTLPLWLAKDIARPLDLRGDLPGASPPLTGDQT